jgi:hypothetical protein
MWCHMTKVKYDLVVSELRQRKGSIRRNELIVHLESLGFRVKLGSSGKHYSYIHPEFTVFPCGTFNGEHGRDDLVKFTYILDVVRLLRKYESEIRDFLGEKNEGI